MTLLTFPTDGSCTTPGDKMEYCLCCQDLLRRFQNIFSKWYNTGLTQSQYNQLPTPVKNKYPYVNQISLETYRQFLNEDLEPRMRIVRHQLMIQKKALLNSNRWSVDIGNLI